MEKKPHEKIDPMWVEIMIASAIGPNLGLYSMLDPEGQTRAEGLKKTLRHMVSQTYYNLVVMGPITNEEFVQKAYLNIMELYNDFMMARMAWMLDNGVPAPKRILNPNAVPGPRRTQ